MGLDNLNKRALDSFENLKKRKGWTSKIVEEASSIDSSIDVKKVQKMLNETPSPRVEIKDNVFHINDKIDSAVVEPMAFLDSLGLSANLSIAIACLLEYNNKGNRKSLEEAIRYVGKEIENGQRI